jgi:ubiquitin carboxyl-terminal hydrolase 25/28
LNIEKLKGYNRNVEPFEEDAQLFLSTFEYDKSKTTRRAPTLTLDEQSWYAGLGCLGDFSDDLVAFGFDRQVATDSETMPYYFDCLTNIAKKRNSETLEMKMVLLASEGCYGRNDVANAYKYFTLDPRQANELTDEYIRGVFESRLGSIPKASEAEAREKLRLMGVSRGSQALLDAASNGESNISLLFLGWLLCVGWAFVTIEPRPCLLAWISLEYATTFYCKSTDFALQPCGVLLGVISSLERHRS